MDENQNESKDIFLTLFCSKISLYYDMCCHRCQRGRLLKIIDQLCIVFDVTQNVKSLPVSIYQAHSGDEDSFHYLLIILARIKFKDSICRVHSGTKGSFQGR